LVTAASKDLISQILMINNQYESDPYLVDLSVRGFRGELTDPTELNMYWSYAATLARYSDMACFQFQQGVLREARLASAMTIFHNQLYLGSGNLMRNWRPLLPFHRVGGLY